MDEFLFFKESRLVRVIGQDEKGFSSELLLASVSPWIGELISSLPSCFDHCIILPDITGNEISKFLESLIQNKPCKISPDLMGLLKIEPGEVFQESNTFDSSIKQEECQLDSNTDYVRKSEEQVAVKELNIFEKVTKVFPLKEQKESLKGNIMANKMVKRQMKSRKTKSKYSKSHLRKMFNSSNLHSYDLDKIEGLISCDVCNKKFLNENKLKRHFEKIHPVNYSCDHCEFNAKEERLLKSHIVEVHGDVPLNCDKCDKKFENKKYLWRHNKWDHEGFRLPCDKCDYKARTMQTLRYHINAVHMKITLPCDICQKVYSHPTNLKKHKQRDHEGIFYMCDQCDYKGTQKRTLRSHIEKVHKGIRYSCDQCNYKFTQRCNLLHHMKNTHKGSPNLSIAS